MRKVLFLFLTIGFLAITFHSKAANITAVSSGNWTSNSTWSCNCQPTNADNITIPAGITVTNSGPVILFLGPVITITISGTLILNNGSIQVDSSDIIKLTSSGKISGTGLLGGTVDSGVIPIFVSSGTSVNGPATISSGSLPITLLFFKGQVMGSSVDLQWASASEKNFDYYSIERSQDGKHFEVISKLPGAGNSVKRLDYSYADNSPLAGVSYYRLQAIDLDGSTQAFDLIEIAFQPAGAITFSVYPNPVTDGHLIAQLNFDPQTDGQLAIFNSQGGAVAQIKLQAHEQEYLLDLPSSMVHGVYYVVIKANDINLHTRVLVQ
jgi:Secretion system C-terminal sorting domain